MAVTYKKLFHLLIDQGKQLSELTELAGFSPNILTQANMDRTVEALASRAEEAHFSYLAAYEEIEVGV